MDLAAHPHRLPAEFTTLYDRYRSRMLRICLRILKDASEAEDTCQEAFIKAMQGWNSFEGRSHPATWITSICLNECRTRLKTRKRRAMSLTAYACELSALRVQPHADFHTLKIAFERGKARLKPAMRKILDLHIEEGLNHREIAERMRVSRVYITQSLGRLRAMHQGAEP